MVKKKNTNKKEPTAQDILKYEITKELGLMDKVNKVGWGGLTARESGRIGGIMTSKMKLKKNK